MLETAAVPALLKAVDWIFGEFSKVLDHRRERQKAAKEVATTGGASSGGAAAPDSNSTGTAQPEDVILTREAALQQPIIETAWKNTESHVKHLLSLIEIHTRNYHLAKEQYAKWGSAMVPPIIAHSMAEAESEIIKTTKELQSTLSIVYRKKVVNPELDRT